MYAFQCLDLSSEIIEATLNIQDRAVERVQDQLTIGYDWPRIR